MNLAKTFAAGMCLIALAACGGGASADGNTVGVTLDEYHLKLDRTAIAAGKITFQIANSGKEKHEFVILRTDLAVNSLPTGADNKVEEEATGIQHIDEIDGVDAGGAKLLTVDLKPGTYLLVCNYPGHVHEGMVAQFMVAA